MSELMPVGNYHGKIIGHDITQLGDKGTPCVIIDVELVSGRDFEKSEVECEGIQKRVIYWLTEKALPFSVKSINELGYTGGNLKGLSLENEESAGLVGTPVRLSIKHGEDHKGVMRERLGLYPANKPAQRMEDSTLARFEKLFQQQQKKLQEEANATAQDDAVDDVESEEVVAPTPPPVPPVKTRKVGNGFQPPRRQPSVKTPF